MTGPVPSPCINVCQMDAGTGWCAGCLRTLDEIGGWSRMADDAKHRVWAQLPLRRVTWQRLHPRSAPAPEADA
jgi:predicted Fe-S protein YdhL (DUF1289 family)